MLAHEMSHLTTSSHVHNFTNSYSSASMHYLIRIQMISQSEKHFTAWFTVGLAHHSQRSPSNPYMANTLRCTWASFRVMQNWKEIGDLVSILSLSISSQIFSMFSGTCDMYVVNQKALANWCQFSFNLMGQIFNMIHGYLCKTYWTGFFPIKINRHKMN